MPVFDNKRPLLEAFRRGEREAMGTVYKRFVGDVETLTRRGFTQSARRIGGARIDEQAELVQETFVRAFADRARSSFDGLRPYRPYLLRITRNLMIDRLRSANGTQGQGVGNIDDLLENGTEFSTIPEIEENLHWAQLSAATKDFKAGLDAKTQEIVRLRFDEEMSQDAVSAQLGCTRRRVRSVEALIRTELRVHLEKLGLLDV
ncbi:MAG: sigma-70 family RNA polymerase sigma factor [Kofleriaceae bacterium]|nr:sigma-70 family RNA polymerase sigma factor [Kofleriaceae bacterium]